MLFEESFEFGFVCTETLFIQSECEEWGDRRQPRILTHCFSPLRSVYAATSNHLKFIDLYILSAVAAAVIQVCYMAVVGSFPFNSFLSGILPCVGNAVTLGIQVNKDKEFEFSASFGHYELPWINQCPEKEKLV